MAFSRPRSTLAITTTTYQFAASEATILLKDARQIPPLKLPQASDHRSGVMPPEVARNEKGVVVCI
jgi:hypothetical protein